jgi:hypothetical protein
MRNLIQIIKHKALEYDPNRITDYDYASIGSLILGAGDVIWLTKDILHNGYVTTYGIIATSFLLGNLLLVYGLHIHHKRAMFHRARRREEAKQKELELIEDLNNQQNDM